MVILSRPAPAQPADRELSQRLQLARQAATNFAPSAEGTPHLARLDRGRESQPLKLRTSGVWNLNLLGESMTLGLRVML